MRGLLAKVREFLAGEEGPTTVEYAVMLGLIIMVCIAAIMLIGNSTSDNFEAVSGELPS